ncbi:SDR family oxidoreductase [Thalassobacillus sp. B23F22_16]|uniref:SDR family oxidoreductase n=1 Tax=Thalassobacillus sp. B23F22_16 TaxID=3459513 RepID=UPI00373EB8E0
MVRVLVIGANGKVGKLLIKKLKDSEHVPVAMVRDTNQVPQFEEMGVETVLGDLEGDFSRAYYTIDAVVFAAGSGPNTGPEKTVVIDQEGAIKSVELAKRFGVQRYVMLSSMGADTPGEGPDAMKHYLYAKHRADEYLKQSGLNYTIVRPGGLTNHPGTGKIKFAEKLNEFGSISREDVAETLAYLLSVPRAEHGSFEILEGDTQLEEVLAY